MKNSPNSYTKKIVSKGKYAQVQGQRGGIMLLGSMLFVMAGVCAFIAICLLFAALCYISVGRESVLIGFVCALFAAFMGAVAFGFAKAYLAAVRKVDEMNNVVPLTRTTAPYLPAQDSLVRASIEPPVAPETILLRAVGDVSATPPEQLVRPSDTPA